MPKIIGALERPSNEDTFPMGYGVDFAGTWATVNNRADIKTRPLLDGQKIFEIDTGQHLKWDAATSDWIIDDTISPTDLSSYSTTVEMNDAITAASTLDRSRENHTGNQAISTISGLQDALDTIPNSHTELSDIGTNSHLQIDSHIDNAEQHRTINDSGNATTDLWSASKINAELQAKQDALTIDSTPIDGSTNPVESNGIFDALATKEPIIAQKNTAFNKNFGAESNTVCEGNDARLSDSRIPTGDAAGVLSGTYPNPEFAIDMATQEELDNAYETLNAQKADVSLLASNITLFPTTAVGDFGYNRMVTNISDSDYNDTAIDIPVPATGSLDENASDDGASTQLVGALIADANLFNGHLGIINIPTIGNIKRQNTVNDTGSKHYYASFYLKIFKRTQAGVETLLAVSNETPHVQEYDRPTGGYEYQVFNAIALLHTDVWLETDRMVIKYYANTENAGTGRVAYNFQFGGTNPVRTELPVPVSVIPSDSHNDLLGRDSTNAHPISAITDLETTLSSKPNSEAVLLKATYDSNNDGTVDSADLASNSSLLEGQDSAFHLSRANHTGSQSISTITDLQASLDSKAVSTNVLELDNTTPYTPTQDYHPATKKFIDDALVNTGTGDMLKSVYDTNDNGMVDNATLSLDSNLLQGQNGAYYLDRTNHTGSQATSTINGLDAALADVALNTTARHEAVTIGTVSNVSLILNGQELSAALTDSGVVAGSYQGLTIDQYGRVTSASDLGLVNQPATELQNGYVTTTTQSFGGDKTFAGNIIVNGDLTINGTTSTLDVNNFLIEDPLAMLARNNASDALDIGFLGARLSGNVGFIWDESSDEFALIQTDDDSTVSGNVGINSYMDLRLNKLTADSLDIPNDSLSTEQVAGLQTLLNSKEKRLYYNFTNFTGNITTSANTFYMNCNPANATQNYTFPVSPVEGDKVGFRISGVSASVVPTLVATIDGTVNVDINENGDFVFVYTGTEWTAILGGVSYA